MVSFPFLSTIIRYDIIADSGLLLKTNKRDLNLLNERGFAYMQIGDEVNSKKHYRTVLFSLVF